MEREVQCKSLSLWGSSHGVLASKESARIRAAHQCAPKGEDRAEVALFPVTYDVIDRALLSCTKGSRFWITFHVGPRSLWLGDTA